MSSALDFLIEEKKQELKSPWIKNIFVRYKIINTRNSLSEAILRTYHKGEYKRTYPELEKFYQQIANDLAKKSKYSSKEIYSNIFQEDSLKKYMRKKEIVLIKDKDDDIRKLGFYFKNTKRKFYFFPKEIRKLPANSNLIKYLASIDINLPYNYFKVRFSEKNEYNNILDNFQQLKETKDQQLCKETINIIKEKNLINHYLSFSKNLFSNKKKEDYKFYLFLYPKIFKINFIILIPFKDNIVIHNIIEEDISYPYLILFQPLERVNTYFKIELGGIVINRKVYHLIDPKKDQDILETIKYQYQNQENNQPLIDFLKYQKEQKKSNYLKDYNLDSEDIYQLLEKLKYYLYEF